MTTRSGAIRSARSATAVASPTSTAQVGQSSAMPALPGAHTTSVTAGSPRNFLTNACSRAPDPMTRIFTGDPRPRTAGR